MIRGVSVDPEFGDLGDAPAATSLPARLLMHHGSPGFCGYGLGNRSG